MNMWVLTNKQKILQFLGIIAYMGIVKAPSISDYWTSDPFFKTSAIPSTMSRNRFELLLRMWHISNNKSQPENDRYYKFRIVVDHLVAKFQSVCNPGETVCIDETIYGVNIFTVCFGKGYTWNNKIYSAKQQDAGNSVPTSVVIQLSDALLDLGCVILTDNYYTSMDFAEKHLEKPTNLLGTLRSNRKYNPTAVYSKKLKRGEMVAQQMTEALHKGKAAIYLSDELSSNSIPLRRSLKWYCKVVIELLLGTVVVNAGIIYFQVTGKKTRSQISGKP
ncbi:hypothetical protein PR048_013986 [Dryococelus australis]|uniref:PiggyBac transposable element-derived protein domain-containing protein n=1 Tax=Dryococelus australis TaxID=614101 RepID=A0ABQ9HVC7_9NEOP|nr:hypothetical protein PR048_013986 [Dryococelus australis]